MDLKSPPLRRTPIPRQLTLNGAMRHHCTQLVGDGMLRNAWVYSLVYVAVRNSLLFSWLSHNFRPGNATDVEVREPNMVQRSVSNHGYISTSPGKHHSVLCSNTGIIKCFGEGHHGELGIGEGKESTNFIQAFPRDTAPTGVVREDRDYKRDIKFVESGAGCNFSIAREVNDTEAISSVNGLDRVIKRIKDLLHEYPASIRIQKIWALIRHEVFLCKRGAKGVLASWGQGSHGQLGSGKEISKILSPTVIPRIADTSFHQIAVGCNHILAIDSALRLFSWGHGGGGRLGHDDFEDRNVPTQISLLHEYYAEQCSAGDAHSGVLVTSRKADRSIQVKRVITFGRNGHGRLGNGKTNNSCRPISVYKFPPSFENAKPKQICCGGAHTLLLFEKKVPKTLANFMGIETYVASWGYGANGQLGTGLLKHELFPKKVRLPKWEVICEVSAGRSWSLAKTIGGDLYTWGKGLRGQLGQATVKFSVAPVKIATFASFLKLGSNYSHNLCLVTQKNHLNQSVVENHFNRDDPLCPIISVSLNRQECSSAYHFNCCRTENLRTKDYFRANCVDCGLQFVCYTCFKICHRGHKIVVEYNDTKEEVISASTTKKNMTAFERITEGSGNFRQKFLKKENRSSGLLTVKKSEDILKIEKIPSDKVRYRNDRSILKPIHLRDDAKPFSAGFTQHKSTDFPIFHGRMTTSTAPEDASAHTMQLKLSNDELHNAKSKHQLHHCLCGIHNKKCRLLPTINESVREEENSAAIVIQRVGRRYFCRKRMEVAIKQKALVRRDVCERFWYKNVLSHVWNKIERGFALYNEHLELPLMIIEENLRRKYDHYYRFQGALQGMDAVLFGVRSLLRNICPLIPKGNSPQEVLSTYAFSYRSIRQLQLNLPEQERCNQAELVKLTKYIPFYDSKECSSFDSDIHKILYRFLKSTRLEKWRENETIKDALNIEKMKNAKREAQLERLRQQGRKQPPPPPPMTPTELAIHQRRLKREQEKKAKEDAERERDEEFVFDPFKLNKKKYIRKRRNSLTDPTALYKRLTTAGKNITKRGRCRRSDSSPDLFDMSKMYPNQRSPFEFTEPVKESLSFFYMRSREVENLFNEYSIGADKSKKPLFRAKSRKILTSCVLNPRLPLETIDYLKNVGRRKTIAEPERLERQLSILFDIRKHFGTCRKGCKNILNAPVRRRSFDFGECKDREEGIEEILDIEVDEPLKNHTVSEYVQMKLLLETRIQALNWDLLPEEFDEKNDIDIENFADIYDKIRMRDEQVKPIQTLQSWEDKGAPEIWQEHFSDDLYPYYYNAETGISEWEQPMGENVQILSQYQDSSGAWYWFNNVTGDTEWIQ